MTRKLKVSWAVLVVALAMTAVLASGAQAAIKVTTGVSPAWSTGEVIEHTTIGKRHSFRTSGGQELSCEEVKFTATETNGATSVTIVPSMNKCEATIGTETHLVTVTMNDCDYLFHGGKEVTSTTFGEGELDLVCPEGKVVELHVYKSATTETEELCTYKIAPFINKNGNEFHNIAGSPNDVTVTTTMSEIAVTRTGSLLCGAASTTATYTGSTTLRAFEDKGGSISNGTVSGLVEGAQVSQTASS